MTINPKELKILVIEQENLDMYIDFVRLTEEYKKYRKKYTKEELIDILNNGGQIFMFKYKNVIASSCILLRPSKKDINQLNLPVEYDDVIEYGNQDVFEDFEENEIRQYMIKKLDTSKNLGFKYAIFIPHPNDVETSVNLQAENFGFVDIKDSKEGIRNFYYKKL